MKFYKDHLLFVQSEISSLWNLNLINSSQGMLNSIFVEMMHKMNKTIYNLY